MTHIKGLGYLKVQTRHIDRWRELTVEGLGFAETVGPDPDGLYLRMDERESRLVVLPGEKDAVVAVGWEVRDQFGLAAVARAVEGAGISVTWLTEEENDQRGLEQVITFTDPGGTPVEIFFGPRLDHSPLITGYAQKFVTGAQGMGHVVLPTTKMDETTSFYTDVLGFLPRGAVRLGPSRPAVRFRFFGVNQRHHSLAIGPAPHGEEPGLVHLMVEVEDLDTVGRALDKVTKLGFSLSAALGRHTNDKMVSFYVRAPGGWDIEFGTAGMLVDESYYTAEEITSESYWGHDHSAGEPLAAFTPPQAVTVS
ncbi:VOC family protein [Arthrobacter sp. APC 3897]|uniref:VOC family protein n=1 Tax=Arthrobacter sp. APC 3897 TaxID=3035204 RepID=UPI0025B4B5E6|nr:VOC family protein [Arthrobacter sp. APC 3897]MDN3480902.1 VOC family protein [Arthrobacter sp. APC 3897]